MAVKGSAVDWVTASRSYYALAECTKCLRGPWDTSRGRYRPTVHDKSNRSQFFILPTAPLFAGEILSNPMVTAKYPASSSGYKEGSNTRHESGNVVAHAIHL